MIIGCICCGVLEGLIAILMGLGCLGCWMVKKFKKHKDDCDCGCHKKEDADK